jgi:hypothetical protein
MKRVLIAGVVLLILVGAVSSGGKHKTETTTSSSPLPEPSATSTVAQPSSHRAPKRLTRCDQNISVNAHASCGFADNVFRAYAGALHQGASGEVSVVEARSPVTGLSYSMRCHGQRGGTNTAICTGATDAAVKFPVIAAREYQLPPTRAAAPSAKREVPAEEEPTTPESGESAGTGEADEVGSSSHATDAEFCSEHECIGSFTAEEGTIVECSDETYSHAGGISGACSHHGGEKE